MKKKFLYKSLILLPVISLSACGYLTRELYDGTAYNDPVFNNNFYREYNESIKPGSSNVHELEEYALDDSKDYVFKTFEDDNFKFLENNYDAYDYQDTGLEEEGKRCFGDSNKLSLADKSFKLGYTSKLFDGRMFCNGNYQIARTQIDESGFGSLFSKEIGSYSYFAMNFKASFDYTKVEIKSASSNSVITLKIGFYLKNSDDSYNHKVVTYRLDKVPTNTGDFHGSSCYVFFGFKLGENINIDRCCGISVSYVLEEATCSTSSGVYNLEQTKTNGISHSLLVYEIMMPHSTWH